jgi:hypothetical protein
MNTAAPLPPLPTIAKALRRTTEVLAQELALPTASAPDWSPFEWQMARAAAVIHGVSPLLASRLRWQGPGTWDAFLQQQRLNVLRRHERIEHLLSELDAAAQQAGIAVMALKGAALHRMGFCRAGERPMGDIDLLVNPADLERVTQCVLPLGYRLTATTWRHSIFETLQSSPADRFGEQADLPVKIEVQTKVAERLPWNEVDITAALRGADAGVGLTHYASIEALLLHQLLHAAGNMSSRWLRMLQLHDIATIAAQMTADSWRRLLDSKAVPGGLWWTYPPLRLAARYFVDAVPNHVLSELAARCPWWLKRRADRYRLSDVSGSYLSVAAIPAAIWSRTFPELGWYLWRRLRPIPEEMTQIGNFARVQTWATDGSWYSDSQWRRILQWVGQRPARPQILHTVRLALQSEHPAL